MKYRFGLLAATMLAFSFLLFTPSTSANANCNSQVNSTFLNVESLLDCVTLEGVRAHQAAFQAIADANGGIRAAGTSGYDASASYVIQQMTAAGYDVSVQEFEFRSWRLNSTPVMQQITPVPDTYGYAVDFFQMTYSGSGDVTASVSAVDLDLGLGNNSSSGCEASDFVGFPAGNIALMQRGVCSFAQKAQNAEDAGAVGAIVFNQGNTEGRKVLFSGTLGETSAVTIPTVSATYDIGEEWANTPDLVLRLSVDATNAILSTTNVFAETRGGSKTDVIMAGAHLDSVTAGPGINDNGSGSAALLEVAKMIQNVNPRNQVRFAWWGAEELGLIGSDYYVYNLSARERNRIAMYLNFDMIGSPNYLPFVYDGSGDAFGLAGPEGSAEIEQFFYDFYADNGIVGVPTQISFRSDYAAFFDFGIPFGGLFTGAEGIKTFAEAAQYGGTPGIQYDPCYHLACDTYDNNNDFILELNADALAAAVLNYAMDAGQSINARDTRVLPNPRPSNFTVHGLHMHGGMDNE